ncbi:MAG TPA: hypothetical protein VNM66_04435, partial [Thermodesulfobacteriota bacterium]|nr:hypothetical protein [Thermodesulfobacteriota bacterium]
PRPARLTGQLVCFVVGLTDRPLEPAAPGAARGPRASPSYPDVIPGQQILREELRRGDDGEPVTLRLRAFPPDIVIAEAIVPVDDLLAPATLELKRRLHALCRRVLAELAPPTGFDEEYAVYCVSGYSGDPAALVAEHRGGITAHLKNERIELDEEEIEATLRSQIKYGKDDLTIVDWDGAFVFDPRADFESNVELLEIVNLQLLRTRRLDSELDYRLTAAAALLTQRARTPVLWPWQIRRTARDLIAMRTQSILESAAIERNIKLIGDWYSAKLYELAARKFHLDDWRRSVDQKLDTLEDVYGMASDNLAISLGHAVEAVLLVGWFVLLAGWFTLLLIELGRL